MYYNIPTFPKITFSLIHTSATRLRVSFLAYRLCRKFQEEHFLSQSFSLGQIELEISEKNRILGTRTCHSSSRGPAEGWELSWVVSQTYPDTFSQNSAPPPHYVFPNVFSHPPIWDSDRIINGSHFEHLL